jgi:hypothetical protein
MNTCSWSWTSVHGLVSKNICSCWTCVHEDLFIDTPLSGLNSCSFGKVVKVFRTRCSNTTKVKEIYPWTSFHGHPWTPVPGHAHVRLEQVFIRALCPWTPVPGHAMLDMYLFRQALKRCSYRLRPVPAGHVLLDVALIHIVATLYVAPSTVQKTERSSSHCSFGT